MRCQRYWVHSSHTHRRLQSFDTYLVLERDRKPMERANNFSSGLQSLIEPRGPLESAINGDFRETVCLGNWCGR